MTGIICVHKEKGMTSFGVVAKVRGITRERKAGHAGTLDPLATGVLPIMLGGATRFLNFFPDSDKSYRAAFLLGETTDTLDITGAVTSESEVNVTRADVEGLLPDFTGTISQIPPMYSAVHVDGKRLYDIARQGREVEREARTVQIKKLTLAHADGESNRYTIEVTCSKGTYIRTIIDDIGQRLGCGAVMTDLIRTGAMGFKLGDCVTIQELQSIKDSGEDFSSVLLSVDSVLGDYEKVIVTEAQARRFSNGGALDIDRLQKEISNHLYRVYSPDDIFLGLGRGNMHEGVLSAARILTNAR